MIWPRSAPSAPPNARLLGQMLSKGINAPVTTSMGRLFDGVAALLDLHQTVSFEGQAAIALEYVADGGEIEAYSLPLIETDIKDQRLKIKGGSHPAPLIINHQSLILDWHPLITAILADLDQRVPIPTIAARFHNALVDAIVAVAAACWRAPCRPQRRRLPEPFAGRTKLPNVCAKTDSR